MLLRREREEHARRSPCRSTNGWLRVTRASPVAYRFDHLQSVQCLLPFFAIDETHLSELRGDEHRFALREIRRRVRGGGVGMGR